MPRLLLVDDNPSIHKIAETLLAATDIDLVCLESADEALRRIHAGELFDVALIDTAMAGMDGWGLLEQLRTLPATARIPIAMMAGVLDTVDPERIQRAPIQGFLKKPVELRELGDRIHKLLESPLPVPPSAVDTIPDAAIAALVAGEPDLLQLGPEDLLVVEAAAPAEAEDAGLELEELDLVTLHGLQEEPTPAPTSAGTAPPVSLDLLEAIEPLEPLEPLEAFEPLEDPAGLAVADAWADEAWEKGPVPGGESTRAADEMPFLVTADELPDLGELVAAAEAPTVTLEAPGLLLEPGQRGADLSLEEELDLGPVVPPVPPVPPAPPPPVPPAPPVPAVAQAAAEEEPPFLLPAAGLGIAAGAAAGAAAVAAVGATAFALRDARPEPAPPPVPTGPTAPPPLPAPSAPGSAQALVDALLQDPAALDALANALASRLSDRALKEVAWEVMPELAARLRR